MSNKKQTAVEWLAEQITYDNGFGQRRNSFTDSFDLSAYFEQAKKMDKQQKIEAYNQGYRDGENDASNIHLSIGDIEEYSNAEQYYKETYEDNN